MAWVTKFRLGCQLMWAQKLGKKTNKNINKIKLIYHILKNIFRQGELMLRVLPELDTCLVHGALLAAPKFASKWNTEAFGNNLLNSTNGKTILWQTTKICATRCLFSAPSNKQLATSKTDDGSLNELERSWKTRPGPDLALGQRGQRCRL